MWTVGVERVRDAALFHAELVCMRSIIAAALSESKSIVSKAMGNLRGGFFVDASPDGSGRWPGVCLIRLRSRWVSDFYFYLSFCWFVLKRLMHMLLVIDVHDLDQKPELFSRWAIFWELASIGAHWPKVPKGKSGKSSLLIRCLEF